MKKRFTIPTLIASVSLLSGVLLSTAQFKSDDSTNEIFDATDPNANWGGVRAIPFGDRYTTNWTSEPKYTTQSPLQFSTMDIGDVWKNYQGFESGDKPITVAVIDSGIDIYHEDFLSADAKNVTITENNVESYSILDPKSCYIHDTSNGYYSSSVKTEVGIKKAYDTDTYDDKDNEYYSHGTASAACIGAAINGVGGLGIAPKCNLLIIRMDFYFTSLDKAIRYAADNGADVINMSLGAYAETFTDGYGDQQKGSSSTATELTSAINYALGKDCVVVAAAGNEKTNHKSYPACNAGVIGVGALDSKSKTKAAGFSNYNLDSDTSSTNNNVDVMAPGYVYTANMDVNNGPKSSGNLKDSSYQNTQGTSFASPLTAGAIALARSKFPNKTHTEIENMLFSTCTDIGNTGWDKNFGYGRVNISSLLGTTYDVEQLTLSESSLELYNNGVTKTLVGDVIPSTATNTLIHWTSSNTNVATVPATSNAGSEVTITPKGVGTTTITAKSDFNQSIMATCTVTVKQYVSSTFTLSVANSTLMEGETTQAIINFTNANPSDSSILYESSNENVATISESGLITAIGAGTTTITAVSADDLQEITITVTGDPTKQTATIVHSDWQTGGSSQNPAALSATHGVLSASVTKGYNTGSQIREYAGGSVTVGVSGGVINSFSINCDDDNNGGNLSITSGGGSINRINNSGKYSISYKAGTTPSSSVTFSNGSQIRFSSIDVAYKLNSTPTPTNYTVSFDSNGGSGSMASATTNGSSYTVPGCTFTKTNYTFSKWALNSASGTQYSVGDTITGISSNITLYALWTENQSTGGDDTETKTATFVESDFVSGSYPGSPTEITKDGITYKYEKTANFGNGIQFQASNGKLYNTASLGKIKSVSMTEKSGKNHTNLKVAFGSSQSAAASASGTLLTTSGINGSDKSYFCITNGTGAAYAETITVEYVSSGGDTPTPTNYTVSFDSNGGSGSMTSATTNGSSYTTPACSFTYNGYTFDKWALNSASGTKYSVGDTITGISADITLYATWTENTTPTPDFGTYYNSITETSGTPLLGQLHDLSVTKHTNYNSYSGDISTTNVFKTDPYSTSSGVIRDFYSGAPAKNTVAASGNDGWNREHVWPQDLSNGLYGTSGPGADIQHIRPTIPKLNSDRGNKKYGELNNTGSASTTTDYNGSTVTGGYFTSSVYQPIDSKKGDVARIIMYMYMHYNKATNIGGTKDGSTSSYFGTLNFTHIISATSEAKAKELLLTWNESDPVDSIETIRNTEAAKITGCRNPFIDHPEYANAIWGTVTPTKTLSSIEVSNPKTTYTVGDSFVAPTVIAHYNDGLSANVNASFSGYNMSSAGNQTVTVTYTEGGVTEYASYQITVSAATVSVTGVTLNKTSTELSIGQTETLTETVAPSNATNKSVTWESNNPSVATVSNGTITAVSSGDATITVKTVDGNKTATCSVTVKSSVTPDPSGNSVTFDFVNDYKTTSGTNDPISYTTDKNGGQSDPAYNTKNSELRLYAKNKLTISGSDIIKIEFVFTGDGVDFTSVDTGTYSSLVWTGDATSVSFIAPASGQVHIKSIVVTYKSDTTPTSDKEITNIELECNITTVVFGEGKGTYEVPAKLLATFEDSTTGYITPNEKNYSINTYVLGQRTIYATYGNFRAEKTIKVTNAGSQYEKSSLSNPITKNVTLNNSNKFTSSNTVSGWKVDLGGTTYIGSSGTSGNNYNTFGSSGSSFSKLIFSYGSGENVYSSVSIKLCRSNASCSSNLVAYTLDENGGRVDFVISSVKNNSNSSVDINSSVPTGTGVSSMYTYTFVAPSGSTPKGTVYIGINGSSGGKQLYVNNLSCTYQEATQPDNNFTLVQQANAWADYFVRLTRTEETCLAADDATKLAGLKDVWSELKTEYEAMVGGAKDEFCTNAEVQDVLRHYQYIISKFNKNGVQLEDFVKDSEGKTPALSSQNYLLPSFKNVDIATIVGITLAVTGTLSIGLYFAIKRRKEI